MRKLNLSERRDSFKKQEAVQEVSFDEPEEKTSISVSSAAPGAQTQPQQQHGSSWIVPPPQTSGEVEMNPMVRRFTLVPQIAVQGSTESEEQDEWEPCSDSEETIVKAEHEVSISSSQQQTAGRPLTDHSCSHVAGAASSCPQAASEVAGSVECREKPSLKEPQKKWSEVKFFVCFFLVWARRTESY